MWNKEHQRIFGLSSSEVKILNSCILEPRSISSISKITGIPRTSLLYILMIMHKRGLVRHMGPSNRRIWQSKNIRDYLSQIPNRHDQENNLGILEIPFAKSSKIIIYRGTDNIIQIFRKISELHKNERVFAMQPDKSFQSAIKKYNFERIIKYNEAFKKKELIIEGIVHKKAVPATIKTLGKQKAKRLFDSFIGRLEDYISIPDDFLDVHSEVYLYRNTVAILSPEKDIAIEIMDDDISTMMRAMLQSLKEHIGRRYSQNEEMKRHSPRHAPVL